jgi:tetratricopeptide (TPR) repeat protein
MTESQNIVLKLSLLILIGSLLSFVPVPNSVTQKIQKVQFAFSAGAYRDQAELLIDLAEENPWWKSLWESAGDAAYLAKEYSLAVNSYQEAETKKALSEEGKIKFGEVYLLMGDKEAADAIWNGLKNSPEALLRLAELYEEGGNLEAAVEVWRSYLILSEEGSTPERLYHFGVLTAAYQPKEALLNLDQVVEEFPEVEVISRAILENLDEEPAYLYVSTGQALAAVHEWRLASYAFKKAAQLRADYLEAWAYLGEALQHLEDPDLEPLDVLERALALDGSSPLVNMFLGLYWQRNGSHITALDHFAVVEKEWPDHPDLYIEQGKSQAALGNLETALEKYQTAINLQPDQGLYYRQLAEFCVAYSYQVEAIGLPAARLAVQLDDQDPAALDVMGQVLLNLDDEMNAGTFFMRAVEADPGYAQAHFHLGILYSARDDPERAAYYLQQAVSTTDNPALLDQAQRLLSSYLP